MLYESIKVVKTCGYTVLTITISLQYMLFIETMDYNRLAICFLNLQKQVTIQLEGKVFGKKIQ